MHDNAAIQAGGGCWGDPGGVEVPGILVPGTGGIGVLVCVGVQGVLLV